jgi:hypothetical protein
MKDALRVTLGLSVFCALAVLNGPADAQTTANGPYYATPSWAQQLQRDTQATCPRFIVLSNWSSEAVLDRETGLVWERSPQTGQGAGNDPVDWSTARLSCAQRDVGGRVGWRLPSPAELASLEDPSMPFLALKLPAGHSFANVVGLLASYWTATADADLPADDAWVVSFGVHPGAGIQIKGLGALLWCVRGGGPLDSY